MSMQKSIQNKNIFREGILLFVVVFSISFLSKEILPLSLKKNSSQIKKTAVEKAKNKNNSSKVKNPKNSTDTYMAKGRVVQKKKQTKVSAKAKELNEKLKQERIQRRKEWDAKRKKEHAENPVYSHFDNGMIFIVMANFSGSLTDPYISDSDLSRMGANFFKGGTGFIMSGEAQLGYVFGKDKWFPNNKTKEFSAVGLFFYFGVGQGVATQSSGSLVKGEQIDVFFTASYTPVINFGVSTKTYFFYNRMAIGISIGTRLIADTTPEYYFYSTHPSVFPAEVGTLIVTSDMMKKMNAFAFSTGAFIEYNQPILRTVQMILRLYGTYNVFKPKYITMPPTLENSAKKQVGFDSSQPVNSFYLNSFDFGISIGLAFKA